MLCGLETALRTLSLRLSARSMSSTALETAPGHADASRTRTVRTVRKARWPVLSSHARPRNSSPRARPAFECMQHVLRRTHKSSPGHAENAGGRGRPSWASVVPCARWPRNGRGVPGHADALRMWTQGRERGPLASVVLTHAASTCCVHSNAERSVCIRVHLAHPAPHLQIVPPGTQTTHTPHWTQT